MVALALVVPLTNTIKYILAVLIQQRRAASGFVIGLVQGCPDCGEALKVYTTAKVGQSAQPALSVSSSGTVCLHIIRTLETIHD